MSFVLLPDHEASCRKVSAGLFRPSQPDKPRQSLNAQQQQHFRPVPDCICAVSNVTLSYVSHYSHEIPESYG